MATILGPDDTTSGIYDYDLDLLEIIEEAFERCGAELRSGYDIRTARRSLNIMFSDWSNRGINLWTMDQGSQILVAGTKTYELPVDTVDLLDHVIRTGTGTNQTDLTISRISEPTYATIPNKEVQGRPIQVWIERRRRFPRFTVWPVPDATQTYTLVYWRMRRIQKAQDGVNTMDVPFRFLPALISGLTYYLSLKLPGAWERMPLLKQEYEQTWQMAADEDREKAPVRFVPRNMRL